MIYTDWTTLVHSLGGVATTWPFSDDGHMGEPAARFSVAQYTTVFNAGHLPTGSGTRTNNTGQWVYVLGEAMTGNRQVVETSPHTMTAAERLANATFAHLDDAADAAGLPSLDNIENTIKDIGKTVLVGVAVTLLVSHFVRKI